MAKKNKLIFLIYFLIFLEIGLILGEYILNLKGITLCRSHGCEIIDYFAKIEKKIFLLAGAFYFLSLLIFFYLYDQTKGYLFRLIFVLLLGAGLLAEVVFSLRQLVEINFLCSFCLTVAFLFFLIFILSLVHLASPFSLWELFFFITGALVSFVISFYLTSINLKPLTVLLNTKSHFWLIHTENCSHCKEVIETFKNKNINLNLIKISQAYPFMKKLNLNQVPTLIYQKSEGHLEIICGKDKILEVLESIFHKTTPFEVKVESKSKAYRFLKSKVTSSSLNKGCEEESRGVCEIK